MIISLRQKKIAAQFEGIRVLAERIRELERALPDENVWRDWVREEDGTPGEALLAAAKFGAENPGFWDEDE